MAIDDFPNDKAPYCRRYRSIKGSSQPRLMMMKGMPVNAVCNVSSWFSTTGKD
jgi:hypothetical protein